MATLTLGNYGVNMAGQNVRPGNIVSATPTSIQLNAFDGFKFVATGTFGFINGQLASGTMNTYTAYAGDGGMYYSASGFAISLATYNSYVTRGDLKGLLNLVFSGNDILNGGAGNDVFTDSPGNDLINGGAGTDAILLTSARTSYFINAAGQNAFQVSRNGATSLVSNVERILFSDGSAIALDINGTAGKAYRVYEAAFNRTPDQAGLSFWINSMDKGESLTQVAQGFVNSAEFKNLYGQAPSASDIVGRFYQNVLNRQPEKAGFDYWVNELNTGRQSIAQVLSGFSESPENQAQVIGSIQGGIAYTNYG